MIKIDVKINKQVYTSRKPLYNQAREPTVLIKKLHYNPVNNKQYIYYIYNIERFINYVYISVCINNGKFPAIMLNSEDKLILDIDNKYYEFICPQTEYTMTELVKEVNKKLIDEMKGYRFHLYTYNDLISRYTNIHGEHWKANMVVVPLH